MEIRNIIVSRTDKIGDLVLSIPSFYMIKKMYPNSKLTVLVRNYNYDVVKNLSYIDEVIKIDDYDEESLENKIKDINADIFVALYSDKRVAKLARVSKAKWRVGPFSKIESFFSYNKGLWQKRSKSIKNEAEYNLDLVITAPSVVYRINLRNKEVLMIESPSKLPDLTLVESMEEPVANVTIITPNEYVGGVMELSQGRRGEFVSMDYLDVTRVMLKYKMPIAEIITDFFNNLKAKTQGYASLDYEMAGYQKADLVKLDVMLNGEPVDALSVMLHRANAYGLGRKLCEKLKEIIPPHQFVVAIQASIGGKVIARETVSALRKDV